MNINTGKKWIIQAMIFCVLLMMPVATAHGKSIYTNNTKIDTAADKIIRKCTTKGMTKEQKLKAVYIYLVKHMHYSHSRGHVRVKVSKKDIRAMKSQKKLLVKSNKVKYSSKFRRRYHNLLTMQGTCYDMSAVFCILANHLGYSAGLNSGRYVRGNGSTCEHWWNHVVIKGKTRYFDVQAANDSWKRHHSMGAVMGFYKKAKGSRSWRKHHR